MYVAIFRAVNPYQFKICFRKCPKLANFCTSHRKRFKTRFNCIVILTLCHFSNHALHCLASFLGAQSSRSVSPISNVSAHSTDERQDKLQLNPCKVRSKSKSLPRLNQEMLSNGEDDFDCSSTVFKSSVVQLRSQNRVTSNPNVNSVLDYPDSLSSTQQQQHWNSSPIALARHLFNLTNLKSSLSPYSSPRNSPRSSPHFGRKKYRGLHSSHNNQDEKESDYVHWWMEDVREGESRHWKQVLDNEGEWSYCWHSIHYRLQPAYSWWRLGKDRRVTTKEWKQ